MQAVADALQRQAVSGGEIDTALLELGVVSENVLSGYRAAAFGARPASREDLMSVSDDTLKLLPVEWAHRLRVVPLSRAGEALLVCAARPLSASELRALEDVVGSVVIVRIAIEVRVDAALAIFYGVQISQRARVLAEQLDRMASGIVPEIRPADPALSSPLAHGMALQGASSATDLGFGSDHRADSGASRRSRRAESLISSPPTLAISSPPSGDPQRPAGISLSPWSQHPQLSQKPLSHSGWPSRHPRRSIVPKGPLSAEKAHDLLAETRDRDDVVEVFFAFARQYFEASACFALRRGQLYGLAAFGDVSAERVVGLSLPVVGLGLLSDSLRSLLPCIVSLHSATDDRTLALRLDRVHDQPCLLLPLAIRQRAVLLFYGDRGGEPFSMEEIGPVLGLVPETVQALAHVIRQRKAHSLPAAGLEEAAPASSAAEVALATAVTHIMPQALDGWGGTARSRSPSRLRGSDDASAALHALGLSRPVPAVPDVSARGASLADAELASGAAEPALVPGPPRASAAPTAPTGDEVPRFGSSKPQPGQGAYRSVRPGRDDQVGAAVPRLPKMPQPAPPDVASAKRRARARRAGAKAPGPGRRRGADGARVSTRLRRQKAKSRVNVAEVARPRGSDPRSAGERTTSSSPSRTGTAVPVVDGERNEARVGSAEGKRALLALPSRSVIVEVDKDVARAVEALLTSGPEDEGLALAALLRLGDAALPTLLERFPGPLWFDRDNPHQRLPLGSDVSAIARALSTFGSRAVPGVAKLLLAPHADTRFYALLLSLTRIEPAYLPAYVELAFDPDPQLRLLIREALFSYRHRPELIEAVASLSARAGDATSSLPRRLDAIEALAGTREPAALPVLVELNTHRERQLAVAAHRALMSIAGRDFGRSARRWRGFVKAWNGHHRVEWLIDGLMQSDERMRAMCGVELQRLTRQYFGYVAGARRRDRERVQKRYLEWWQTEGRRLLRPSTTGGV